RSLEGLARCGAGTIYKGHRLSLKRAALDVARPLQSSPDGRSDRESRSESERRSRGLDVLAGHGRRRHARHAARPRSATRFGARLAKARHLSPSALGAVASHGGRRHVPAYGRPPLNEGEPPGGALYGPPATQRPRTTNYSDSRSVSLPGASSSSSR